MENKEKSPDITEAQLREFYIPDGPCTAETSAEFREKNNLKTFEDIEAVRKAKAFYEEQSNRFFMVGLTSHLLHVEKYKEWEVAEKCFQLIAESTPTVQQALSILGEIDYLVKKERITKKL